jgi:hypothetical protein
MINPVLPPNYAVKNIDKITTSEIWRRHETYIYQSKEIGEILPFYPIYKYKDFYSFSLLALIAHKGYLRLAPTFASRNLHGDRDVAEPNPTIDAEVSRLGGQASLTQAISDADAFTHAMSEAMRADITEVCNANPGSRHIVLCGGRDSLNILLHRWSAPVVAYSAEPNYPLVARFVDDNKLGIDVRRLEDPEPQGGLDREIAEASCLVRLENWKWTEHLRQIARAEAVPPVFWKGQVADAYLTDYWRSYTHRSNKTYKFLRKAYKIIERKVPNSLDPLFVGHAIADFEKTLWLRASVGQGAHLGLIRSICNCLALSAYHGPRTLDVMHRADLRALTRRDIRVDLGRALLGRDVKYPTENPGPPASGFREGTRTVERYVAAIRSLGIDVKADPVVAS